MMRVRVLVLTGLMLFGLITPALAQDRVEFWRVREGSRAEVVLDTGGECHGNVVRRVAGALEIKLTEASSACGGRDSVVTVSESNAWTVELAEVRREKKTVKKFVVVALAAGAGFLLPHTGRAAIGVIAGSAEAVHLLNRDIDRPDMEKTVYVLYVSRLGSEEASQAPTGRR